MPWISAAGSIAGGLISAGGASKAAKAQAKATNQATSEQRYQAAQTRNDLAPWRLAGGSAVSELAMLLGLSPGGMLVGDPGPEITKKINFGSGGLQTRAIEQWRAQKEAYDAQQAREQDPRFGSLNKKFTLADFWDDPVTKASYEQGLDQGTKALANMAGARGNRNSGAQLKALTRFSTDYTGNQAGQSYNRFYGDQDRIFNRLSGLAGTGQTATTSTALLGQNSANNISNLLSAQGNARGAAAIANSNALGGAIRNIGNIFSGMNSGGTVFDPNSSYNASGQFQPFYSGYGIGGDYQYG